MENIDILLEVQIICVTIAIWSVYHYILNKDRKDK